MSIFSAVLLSFSVILCFCLTLLYYTHMYQLNSYKPSEQLAWIKASPLRRFAARTGLPALAVLSAFVWSNAVYLQIVIFLLAAFINRPFRAKKPLVFTNRVKRLLASASVIFLAVSGGACIALGGISSVAPAIICIFMPFYLLLCDLINKPLEKAINNGYIRNAKEILRSSPNLTVIGITGSFGKTSVKFFLNKILSGKYNVLMTPGNFNTTLGVVRTIRENLRATHEIFICEMGARHVGDIKEICDIVNPKYGIITSVGEQHMETFKSIDNIINTKFELYNAVPADGKVFLNGDNPHIRSYPKSQKSCYYGINNTDADFYAYDLQVSSKGSQFSVHFPDNSSARFSTSLIGEHNVLNITAAISAAYSLGMSAEQIADRVTRIESVPHRMQLIPQGNNIVIDDAYNSNPDGAAAALDTLAMFDGVKILVTPGMIELGERQYDCNKQFGAYAAQKCDFAVLVGRDNADAIKEGLLAGGFHSERIHSVNALSDAINLVGSLQAESSRKIILLENDLPDNFN